MVALLLAAGICIAGPGPELTDLWDAPVDLPVICRSETTLVLICDPGTATCREAAVYFDSKAEMIRDEGVRPAIILLGDPPAIRETVLQIDINIPVFIDTGESVFGTVLEERILPALVLMSAAGQIIDTIYGGGDSLDNNIRTLILTEVVAAADTAAVDVTEEDEGFNWWLVVVPVVVALAVLPFVLD